MGSLTMDRKVLSVPLPAIGAHFHVTPDVVGNIAPQIAFDFIVLVKKLANFHYIVIGQLIAF
jgi:hypothetical protein